ncbi:MAG: hypothetical protein Kow0089_05610 [Desulfobulbaceae bacterium]
MNNRPEKRGPARTSATWIWLLVLALVAASSLFAFSIEVKEDAMDLLPDGVVTSDLELIRRLGMVNRVYLSLGVETAGDAVTPEEWQRLKSAVRETASRLRSSPLLTMVADGLPPEFERSLFSELWPLLPIMATDSDYRIFAEAVSEGGVRVRLRRAFQLLNSPAGIGLAGQVTNDPLGFSLLLFDRLRQLRGEFAVTMKNGLFASADGKSCLIWADSAAPLTDSVHALQVQKLLDETFAAILGPGITAEVIGTLPHTLANVRTVKRDLKILLPLATVLLVGFLLVAFRDPRALLVVGIPFLAAPPAIALQRLFCGKVSGLALGFGIVLTGLAVDFAVHIYLTLRREPGEARRLLARLRRPLLLAWCTTTGVFVVLLFSAVPSHRQMAVLAISGITLAVLFSWLLVPSVVRADLPAAKNAPPLRFPRRWRTVPVLLWLCLLLAGVLSWPSMRFNGDMRVLDATNSRLKDADTRFHETWRGSVDQALLLARGTTLDRALDVNDTVYRLLSARPGLPLQSVSPLLPGPTLRAQRTRQWREFWADRWERTSRLLDREGRALGFREGSFAPFIRFIAGDPAPVDPEKVVNGPLSPLLSPMVRTTFPDGGGAAEALVLTLVPENDATWPVLRKLRENGIPGLSIISFRTWREQVETLLRHDLVRLSLLAGLAVTAVVAVFLRRTRPVLAALAPVCSALAAMSVFSLVTGQEINIMHVLMGIMVIGLCVDYGIFSVCAAENHTTRTTRTAVSICAVSSCIGFGVLALAAHPALFSLGTTVLVGITAAWPTAVFVTPALLPVLREAAP